MHAKELVTSLFRVTELDFSISHFHLIVSQVITKQPKASSQQSSSLPQVEQPPSSSFGNHYLVFQSTRLITTIKLSILRLFTKII